MDAKARADTARFQTFGCLDPYDFCYRRTSTNLERLADALKALKLTLRGAPPDLKFKVDTESLAPGCNLPFEVEGEYPLDLLGQLEPIGSFDALLHGAENFQIAGRMIRVIGLDDLVRISGIPPARERAVPARELTGSIAG